MIKIVINMSHLEITEQLLHTLPLSPRLPATKLCALVVPDTLLHVEHEPGLLQPRLLHSTRDHQHLEIRSIVFVMLIHHQLSRQLSQYFLWL